MAQPTIARIERDQSSPRLRTAERLLAACGYRLTIAPAVEGGVGRTAIRELLARTPLERLELATQEAANWAALVEGELE